MIKFTGDNWFLVKNMEYDDDCDSEQFYVMDAEDAAEKYAEKYFEDHIGEWDEGIDITVKVVMVKSPSDSFEDKIEEEKFFNVHYSIYPSFYANEIDNPNTDEEEYFDE